MTQTFSYAAPRNIERMDDCYFYHKMDLPGVGEVGESWDLRSSADDYLGRFDFSGKRVLDMGAASGFLTFEMEKRGADVVSFEMLDGAQWDVVPHVHIQPDLDTIRQKRVEVNQRLKNAYWFAHKHLGSKARGFYGDIYDLPGDLGAFDVAYFGMILSHLRDPFQALYSASRLVRDTIIVTNQMGNSNEAIGNFIPSRENGTQSAWWSLTRGCLTRMLAILGFEVQSSTVAEAMCVTTGRVGIERCTSLVAKRVAGSICLTGSARYSKAA